MNPAKLIKQAQKLAKDKRVKQAANFIVKHQDEIGKVASKALGSKGKKGILGSVLKLIKK